MSTEVELSAVDLKVIELYNKYFDLLSKKDIYVGITKETKECCLIAVDEIIYSLNKICGSWKDEKNRRRTFSYDAKVMIKSEIDFYKKIKEKIKTL